MTEKKELMECEIYQHGELYNSRVYMDRGSEKDNVSFGCIRSDKVNITWNTKKKIFTVRFVFNGIRLVECEVNKIYIYDLEENNRISFPDIDVEWPYEDVIIEMAEKKR